MRRLTIRCGDEVRHFPLPEAAVRLGSAPDNDLPVPFRGVSRTHLEITSDGAGLVARDLGSRNGLRVDGRRLAEVRLVAGVPIQVGEAFLVLEELSSSEGEAAFLLDGEGVGAENRRERDTDSLEEGPSSAAAALHVVRAWEAKSPPDRREPAMLRSARRALGAEVLAIARVAEGEPAIVAADGELPDGGIWDVVGAAKPGPVAVHRLDSGCALIVAGRSGDALVALLPASRAAVWQRDFFAYLADALLGGQAASPGGDAVVGELVFPRGMVVGTSAAVAGLLRHVQATLRSDQNVLLLGETGTGKELFARMVHLSGRNADGPFVAINCAAIPAELLEAELFGVVARVATGVDPRPGLFLQAHGGTIFLDEIGDMPERLQAKLLRALQEHEVLPVGGTIAKKIDVRVIAASNRDLARLVNEGTFRADLYYRLRGLQFHIPPLRERRDDIPQLVATFASRASQKYGKRVAGVSRRALATLTAHPWPGNIRELESEVERAVLLCPEGGTLQTEHFATVAWASESGAAFTGPPPVPTTVPLSHGAPAATLGDARRQAPEGASRDSLREQVDALEREAVVRALSAAAGNRSRAARVLGLTRNGLASKMKRLGLR